MEGTVSAAIALATSRKLASLVDEDGSFIYAYDSLNSRRIEGYNLLRHAGCVWALNVAADRFPAFHELRAASRRALLWLCNGAVYASPLDGRCVAADGVAKLGGTALTIVALVTSPGFNEEGDASGDFALMEDLCLHLLACLRRNDYGYKLMLDGGSSSNFQSSYYLGQALFALNLAGKFLSDEDLRFVDGLLAEKVDQKYGIAEQSHWMVYAVCAANSRGVSPGAVRYLLEIVRDIIVYTDYRGDRCTPIACRTEALAAAGVVLATEQRDITQLRVAIGENLLLQVKDLRPDGAFVSGSSTRVRIDYLQHNLASILLSERVGVEIGATH